MKFLLIDDDPTESSLTKKTLLDKFVEVQIVEVSEHDQLESILSQADFDLVISEYRLRWTTGLMLFRQIRDRYACVPFIILTGSGNEEVAVATIKAGVDDYLSKVNRLHLNNAVMQCLSKVAGKKIPD